MAWLAHGIESLQSTQGNEEGRIGKKVGKSQSDVESAVAVPLQAAVIDSLNFS